MFGQCRPSAHFHKSWTVCPYLHKITVVNARKTALGCDYARVVQVVTQPMHVLHVVSDTCETTTEKRG